jgi:methionine transaminase
MPGVPQLREEIAKKVEKMYSCFINPTTEITITAGATQAIYTAISAVINKGDEVILFDPGYDCYIPAIEYNGGIPVRMALKGPEFKIDWEEVTKHIGGNTKMIIVNTPHNPTGSILTAEDMLQLQSVTDGTEIIILSDEVYEHVIFDGASHQSILKYPQLAQRSFVVFSFGKTFHATGWKVGYCIAPKQLMDEFRQVHQFLVFSVNTAVQHALADYMSDERTYSDLGAFYQEKRDYFSALLKNSRFVLLPCSGSYFQTVDYSEITDEEDTKFAIRLTNEFGVAAIPLSVFYKNPPGNRYLRFCFAKKKDTLKKAATKLCEV